MKLAFLGGSFNPLHIGHLFLADEVRTVLGYDKVLFVPAFVSPFKQAPQEAAAADRLAMLRAAVSGNPFFAVDDREINRGGVSYTYDTACSLVNEYRNQLSAPLALIMGDDLVADFSAWHNPQELSNIVDLVVGNRCTGDVPKFSYRHIRIDNALLPVSSSDIRERIHTGKSWRYLVPPAVYDYIVRNNLYGYTK